MIEYCLANTGRESVDELRDSAFRTRPAFCLDHCGECCETDFLVVDGEVCVGDSHEALLRDAEQPSG